MKNEKDIYESVLLVDEPSPSPHDTTVQALNVRCDLQGLSLAIFSTTKSTNLLSIVPMDLITL